MITKCPYCAEEIQAEAVKCKHCGSWLNGPPEGPGTVVTSVGQATAGRLVRSTSNRMIAGLCGGLGHYLGIDPTIIRIVVAVATFFTAVVPGVVLYLILSFVVPTDEAPHS